MKIILHALGTILWAFAVSIGLILLFLSDMILAALSFLGLCMGLKLHKAVKAMNREKDRVERLERRCAELDRKREALDQKLFR